MTGFSLNLFREQCCTTRLSTYIRTCSAVKLPGFSSSIRESLDSHTVHYWHCTGSNWLKKQIQKKKPKSQAIMTCIITYMYVHVHTLNFLVSYLSCFLVLQWNLYIKDTTGIKKSVLIREVSSFQGEKCMVCVNLGPFEISWWERCPHLRGVL